MVNANMIENLNLSNCQYFIRLLDILKMQHPPCFQLTPCFSQTPSMAVDTMEMLGAQTNLEEDY